ncbi:hypothetical protein E2562_029206 [Oryza meyeriana var. granulata]|uniref:Uncharacterized protein n=1 Tax=Oryza meyeriana var. granulata TaxID=110450 RepID=A0A6G1E463_9ORYZ|nr:hypothetical protein E2562_029206 [Oryza meyeriana var. granulata]
MWECDSGANGGLEVEWRQQRGRDGGEEGDGERWCTYQAWGVKANTISGNDGKTMRDGKRSAGGRVYATFSWCHDQTQGKIPNQFGVDYWQ